MSKQRTEKNGTKNDEWETPDYVYSVLDKEFNFNYDIACNVENCKCLRGSSRMDGLQFVPYKNNLSIWCNPPYSVPLKDNFIKKCYELSLRSEVNQVVVLIPSATETRTFHDIIWKHAKEIRFIDKRVRFKGYNTNHEYVTNKTGQSGSMIIIFQKRNIPMLDNPCVKTQHFER